VLGIVPVILTEVQAMSLMQFSSTLIVLSLSAAAIAAELGFEDLGVPVRVRDLRFSAVTQDPAGHCIAWAAFLEPCLRRCGLVGVRTDNGETVWHDLSKYGEGKVTFTKAEDGNLYVYAGNPAHFLRYDVAKRNLDDLGVPVKRANYFGLGALAADGKYYIGSYPTASLACCDTRTGKIANLGRMPEDPRQCYLFPSLAVSDDLVVYCPVGLHHMELWAYDTRSGTKKQILPERLARLQGAPRVWRGTDGQVYGRAAGTTFLCRPDAIEPGKSARAAKAPPLVADDKTVGSIDSEGVLQLTDTGTGQTSRVSTTYEGRRAVVWSVGCGPDGVIYGSCALPGRSFSYDPGTGKLTDLGIITKGTCQVYDVISLPQGLFMCSYFGAHVDLYDPAKPIQHKVNPRYLGCAKGQERPVQWCLGPDGMLYTGTGPAKGRLGGTLMQVNPNDLSLRVWPTPIPNQSVQYVTPVPETGELFCTSSIHGGSSSIPTEKEGCVFLWDTKKEAMVFRADPVPGTPSYGRAVRAGNGLIYGVAGQKYYVFDPKARTAVFTGALPVKRLRFPQLHGEPVGAAGLIYGLGDDALFAIDPADNSVRVVARHKSIARAHGFCITPTGDLYYGSGATLMRCKLGKG